MPGLSVDGQFGVVGRCEGRSENGDSIQTSRLAIQVAIGSTNTGSLINVEYEFAGETRSVQ